MKEEVLKRVKSALKALMGKSSPAPAIPEPVKTPYFCPVCKQDNVWFGPLPLYYFRELDKNQFIHSIFQLETLNLEFYACSNCHSPDRDRLYALYFDKVVP